MGSSLNLDDFGVIRIRKQISETGYSDVKFHVSELLRYKHKPIGIFSNGSLTMYLEGGQEHSVVIPRNQKEIFILLIAELDRILKEAESGSKDKQTKKLAHPKRSSKPVNSVVKPSSSSGSTNSAPQEQEFVAIDIEWTDGQAPTSICEIGLVVFRNGEPIDTYRRYIRPPSGFVMGTRESSAHGIDKSIIDLGEPLKKVWGEIDSYISGRVLVLHNATNDVNKILSTLLDSDYKDIKDFDYLDTMLIAKKLPWIKSKNGLSDLAEFFEIERQYATYDGRAEVTFQPHGALEDALLTGYVLTQLMKSCNYNNLTAFIEVIGAYPGKVRNSALANGFSSPGKLQFSTPAELPSQEISLSKAMKYRSQAEKAEVKRVSDEDAQDEFLKNPQWSNLRVKKGHTICFTQLMNWDDEGNDHKTEVEDIARSMGLTVIYSVRSDLDLLVVNDPWINDSAKLRNAVSRKKPIPVTTFSIFQSNNPEFPAWKYLKSSNFEELKSAGIWPTSS
jgi:DNA polymerase III epsilon subunit-like protein